MPQNPPRTTPGLLRGPARLLALVLALALAACQNVPRLPPVALGQGDRIGVIVEAPPTPLHTHIGTTVFNNFEHPMAWEWKLETDVRTEVSAALEHAGFVPVDLSAAGIRYDDLNGLVQLKDGAWRISEDHQAMVTRLTAQLGLRGVVALKADTRVMLMQCGAYGCSNFVASGPGLFSRSLLTFSRYWAAAAFSWHVYTFDPAADFARTGPIAERLNIPAIPLTGYELADFDHPTEADFVPVHDAIVRFAGEVAGSAGKTLRGQ